jgi:hypothetical protein
VFSGTGSQTVFTLASDPGALGNSAQVFIGGVYQQRSTYTIAGTTLTFSQAPVAGTDNIEFVNYLTSSIGATSADLVTYTPSGTSAVARSAASKFAETVSVKDFGAVGDGVVDDAPAINAAIAALGTRGGLVFLPYGVYRIQSTIEMNTRCILRGEGGGETSGAIGAVVIKKAASMTTPAIRTSSACCRIEYLVVNGDSGNTGDGIAIESNGSGVANCAVSGMGGVGIRIGKDTATNSNSWSLRDIMCRGNASHGIYVHEPNYNANAGVAVRVASTQNGGDGIRNRHGDKNTYVGCLVESNTGYGWHFLNDAPHSAQNTVIGGDTEGNTAGNVLVTAESLWNTFVNPGILEPTATFVRNTTLLGEGYHRLNSGGSEEWLSNGPQGGPGTANLSEYMSVYDASAERVRFGYVVKNTVTQGLIPSQFMHDNYGACMASRAVNYGSCRFAAGTGPALLGGFNGNNSTFWIGPGPTDSTGLHVFFQTGIATGWNAAAAGAYIGKDSTTSRSINAAGTLNASGTDYAEYMFKADPAVVIQKGDVCGIDSTGKLTTQFADAISFVVKSTNPSYVGGDTWAQESIVGKAPTPPVPPQNSTAEETARWETELQAFEAAQADFVAKIEVERVKVDRIAFSGQVPVNVTGANVGDYIVPQADGLNIVGVPVAEADITFAQYRMSVGRVISIGADGRANIIVKVA